MEMRDLLEKMMKFAGEKVGQKPGDQWRGDDPNPPGKKLVGDSILKDLSKGKSPKSREQELAEEFQAFLEAEFKDTVDKRPSRKGARPARGHVPQPRYKTVKADESYMSEKDIELQDYRSMTNQEFQTAYGMSKMEWINQNKALVIQNTDLKRALGLEEAEGQEYTVIISRRGRERPVTGTIQELLGYFGYTLEVGKSYEHERGRYKINMNPKNVVQLVDALNKAASNGAANSAPNTYYSVGNGQLAESHYKWEVIGSDGKVKAVYHHNSPHYKDQTAASDIAYTLKSNPGTKIVATKDDQPFDWQGLLSEGWESGPEEYKEPYDDADDAYDRRRQEKLDIEAEKANAKRPQEKVYTLLGRGPNMEPNYKFPGEYKSQEDAIAARERIMADPDTPHPEHIGIHSFTRYLDQTNEAVMGGGGIKNLADYTEKRDYIYQQLADPKQRDNYAYFKQALFDLNRLAKEKGINIAESRAHKQLSTWFKNRELAQKFASGEVKIPTPQERRAELEKSKEKKEKVDEYGADNPPQKTSPSQTQQAAANLNIQKTALSQLKQINPEIDPQKAATAMTKDPATMSPQEKDELAQVAKTVSPALGTPAFGSIKTALQKSQVQK